MVGAEGADAAAGECSLMVGAEGADAAAAPGVPDAGVSLMVRFESFAVSVETGAAAGAGATDGAEAAGAGATAGAGAEGAPDAMHVSFVLQIF